MKRRSSKFHVAAMLSRSFEKYIMVLALIWLALVSCFVVVSAALGRGHSALATFGFLLLCFLGTPVLSYALLVALPCPHRHDVPTLTDKL